MTLERPEGFETFLKSLKERISSAQTRAALAVSRELLELYWTIGRDLEQFAAQLVSQLPWGQCYQAVFFILQYRKRICATGCGTNSLGTQRGALRKTQKLK